MLKLLKICMGTLLLAGCGPKDKDLSELIIETDKGPVVYKVESAVTEEEMSQGLMDRKELRADSGMIFNLNGTKGISMWMKDTYIALDMLFVNQDGKIVWIYENAEPLSTRLIKPQTDELLSAVVEINAGEVKKNGIMVGDLVKHELIQK